MSSWIDNALEEKERLTPDKGYNVVGFDDGGTPDEWGLYLVGNFPTEEEANKMLQKAQEADPQGRYYVYPPREKPSGLVKKLVTGKDV